MTDPYYDDNPIHEDSHYYDSYGYEDEPDDDDLDVFAPDFTERLRDIIAEETSHLPSEYDLEAQDQYDYDREVMHANQDAQAFLEAEQRAQELVRSEAREAGVPSAAAQQVIRDGSDARVGELLMALKAEGATEAELRPYLPSLAKEVVRQVAEQTRAADISLRNIQKIAPARTANNSGAITAETRELLEAHGYSPGGTRKTFEGTSDYDRRDTLDYIGETDPYQIRSSPEYQTAMRILEK